MYARCGFVVKGLSQLVLGKDPWYEMSVDLDATEPRLRRFVQVSVSHDSRGKPLESHWKAVGKPLLR